MPAFNESMHVYVFSFSSLLANDLICIMTLSICSGSARNAEKEFQRSFSFSFLIEPIISLFCCAVVVLTLRNLHRTVNCSFRLPVATRGSRLQSVLFCINVAIAFTTAVISQPPYRFMTCISYRSVLPMRPSRLKID